MRATPYPSPHLSTPLYPSLPPSTPLYPLYPSLPLSASTFALASRLTVRRAMYCHRYPYTWKKRYVVVTASSPPEVKWYSGLKPDRKQLKGSCVISGRLRADPAAGAFVIGLTLDGKGRLAVGKKVDHAGGELRLKLKSEAERDQWVQAITMLFEGGAAASRDRVQATMAANRELL